MEPSIDDLIASKAAESTDRIITGSEVRTFRQCRRKHYLGYVALLRPKTLAHSGDPFFIGSAYHLGLELYGRGMSFKDIVSRLLAEFKKAGNTDVNEDFALVREMVRGYIRTFREDDKRYELVAPEREFLIEFPRRFGKNLPRMAGKIDGIKRDIEKANWVEEHKTASKMGDDYFRMLHVDTQHPMYVFSAEQAFGINVKGVIYNVARKSYPKPPKHLFDKDGKFKSLSKAMEDNVTYWSFLDEINRIGLDISDYSSHLEKLKMLPERYHHRRYLFLSRDRIESTVHEYAQTIREMMDPNLSLYGNPSTFTCKTCPYLSLCSVWHNRSDVADTISLRFERKEKAHEELTGEYEGI